MPIGNDGFPEADLALRLTGTNPANFLEAGAIPSKTTEFAWHFLYAQDTNPSERRTVLSCPVRWSKRVRSR